MQDSVACRGSVLWNAVTYNYSALANDIPCRGLRLKLIKSLDIFNKFSFKITFASTLAVLEKIILYIILDFRTFVNIPTLYSYLLLVNAIRL